MRTNKIAQSDEERSSTDGVAAVDRALMILDAFTMDDAGLTLSEIARRTGLYKSTALRLSESLEKFGYLRRDEEVTCSPRLVRQ